MNEFFVESRASVTCLLGVEHGVDEFFVDGAVQHGDVQLDKVVDVPVVVRQGSVSAVAVR